MSDRTVRVFCSDKCAFDGATLLEIEDLVQQIIANGGQIPSDYVPKTAVNAVIEQNKGQELKIWVGTQAEYNAYTGDKSSLFAIISDDQTKQYILDILDQHTGAINNIITGVTPLSVKRLDGTMAQIVENEQGVFKVGEEVITRKKYLYRDATGVNISSSTGITLSENVSNGDILEIGLSGSITPSIRCTVGGEIFQVLAIFNIASGLTTNTIKKYIACGMYQANISTYEETGNIIDFNSYDQITDGLMLVCDMSTGSVSLDTSNFLTKVKVVSVAKIYDDKG